jgi:hypothetical protein
MYCHIKVHSNIPFSFCVLAFNVTWNKFSSEFTTHSMPETSITRLHTQDLGIFSVFQEELLQLTFPQPRMTVPVFKMLPAQRTTLLVSRNSVPFSAISCSSEGGTNSAPGSTTPMSRRSRSNPSRVAGSVK